jgi:hypothetical protein
MYGQAENPGYLSVSLLLAKGIYEFTSSSDGSDEHEGRFRQQPDQWANDPQDGVSVFAENGDMM